MTTAYPQFFLLWKKKEIKKEKVKQLSSEASAYTLEWG